MTFVKVFSSKNCKILAIILKLSTSSTNRFKKAFTKFELNKYQISLEENLLSYNWIYNKFVASLLIAFSATQSLRFKLTRNLNFFEREKKWKKNSFCIITFWGFSPFSFLCFTMFKRPWKASRAAIRLSNFSMLSSPNTNTPLLREKKTRFDWFCFISLGFLIVFTDAQ